MSIVTEDEFLVRREAEELVLVLSSQRPEARDAHQALADAYHVRLEALRGQNLLSAGCMRNTQQEVPQIGR